MDNQNIEFSFDVFFIQMFILLSIGLWIYTIKRIVKHKNYDKLPWGWLLFVVLVPTLGAFTYIIKHRS